MISFDTNVLLYAADRRDPRKQAIPTRTLREADNGIILWQAACEFIAASRKLAAFGLTTYEAWDPLSYHLATFPLALPTPRVLQTARDLHMRQHWSFWDAMLVAACLNAGVTCLYAEDIPGQPPPLASKSSTRSPDVNLSPRRRSQTRHPA